jgi:hypothetical protein
MTVPLREYLAQQLAIPVTGPIAELAEMIRARHQHTMAILAYGSALRELDPSSTLIDYYVITQVEEGVSSIWLSRAACKLVPPNVYYIEAFISEKRYRAKYAALSIESLAKRVSHAHVNPYFWVRFAQPMQIVWHRDEIAFQEILAIVQTATETAANTARSLAPTKTTVDQWTDLFEATYQTELRPEAKSRARQIATLQSDELGRRMDMSERVSTASTAWVFRRWQGKTLSVMRLLKAGFTFQGGADYAAWKISRHSGVVIEVTDWHRRHPVLASIMLLPKLLRRGAIK